MKEIKDPHLDSIKWTSRTLRMELHAPNTLARFLSGLNAFHRRVVAIDKEGLPAFWERVRKLKGVLVILARGAGEMA